MNFKKERRAAEAKAGNVPYSAYTANKADNGVLHPLCTKAIYKRLKKAAKK